MLEQFSNRSDSYRWDFIVRFINKIKKERVSEINTYSSRLLALLMTREESYSWEYDGIDRAYEVLIPYLEIGEIKKIFADIVKRYFSIDIYKYKDRIDLLNNDLESFIYCYYEVLPHSDSQEVIESILDMHKTWLTGNGVLAMKTYYKINETLELPISWMDLFNKIESKVFYT